jgi:hypothetical protein
MSRISAPRKRSPLAALAAGFARPRHRMAVRIVALEIPHVTTACSEPRQRVFAFFGLNERAASRALLAGFSVAGRKAGAVAAQDSEVRH